jgi:glycolate oxidase iron-sulfur subunit
LFPNVAEAAVKVLDHHGVGVFMPSGQACCGIPAVSSGDAKTFEKLVRHNLERFGDGGYEYLITACATCTATIHEVWPMLIQDAGIRDRVRDLADKTLDINQFLVKHVGISPGASSPAGDAVVVTYHDPCHLKKSLGVAAEPRALIRANPAYELKEMPESDWCCGLGGSFNLQYYETSARIGRKKRDNIRSVDPAAVATGCPACMIQISDMLSKAGDRIAVRHPVEIYAESLGLI